MLNTRTSVRNHYGNIKQKNLNWEEFIQEILRIDDDETRWDGYVDEVPVKKNNLGKTIADNSYKKSKVKSTEAQGSQKRSRFNISSEEYKKRRSEGACLKCGKKGHFASECPENTNKNKAFNLEKEKQN